MKKILFFPLICMAITITGCTSGSGQNPSNSEITSTVVESEISEETSEYRALDDSIQKILNDKEYYPDITAIDVNSTYTEFTITLESDVMNTYESMLVMSFYTIGNEYQTAAGISPDKAVTTVRYINGSTGDIISESDSSSMVIE